MTATATAPLEVDLPVCDICGNIARYDPTASGVGGKLKFACAGPKDAPHKATKMKRRRFREVEADN